MSEGPPSFNKYGEIIKKTAPSASSKIPQQSKSELDKYSGPSPRSRAPQSRSFRSPVFWIILLGLLLGGVYLGSSMLDTPAASGGTRIPEPSQLDAAEVEVIVPQEVDNSPSARLAPVNSPQAELRITAEYGARLRAEPSTEPHVRIIMVLENQSVVELIGRNASNSWYLVRLPDGTTGWVGSTVSEPTDIQALQNVEIVR